MIRNRVQVILFISAVLFAACDQEIKEDSYQYQIDNFLETVAVDTSELVDYELLTGLRDSLLGKEISGVQLAGEHKDLLLSEIDGPVVIESFASWCSPCVSLLPALNLLADKYRSRVTFVLVTQESYNNFEMNKFEISDNIEILHANADFEPSNVIYLQSGNFKVVLPFPSTYFIDKNKSIKDVKIGAPRVGTYGGQSHSQAEVTKMNLRSLESSIDQIIDHQMQN